MAPSYKLQYFNGRGRGEIPRLLLAAAGQKFEDVRIEQEDWPAEKGKTPFGSMPVLTVDGKWLAQSGSVCRYLAAKFNLLGDSDISAAYCDMVWESVGEGYFKCLDYAFNPDEEARNKGVAEVMEKTVLPMLARFEAKQTKDPEKGNKDHLIAGKLTLADIALAYYCDEMSNFNPHLYDTLPSLHHVVKTTLAHPNIKAWIDNRVPTPF